jgi:tetratricopeptide (TPR) repeat protein
MNTKMKKLVLFGLITAICSATMAQSGWKWPEDVEKAKESNALYVDAVKSKQFATAVAPHAWLLENAPDLNKSLYINGAKIYQGLEVTEKDAAKKSEYQAKALEMYDLRIKYFGDEANVLNRKAYNAYKYYKGDRSKYGELIALFDKTFNLNKEKTLDNNLMAYMDVVRRYKLSGGDLTDEQVIDKYGLISDVIDKKIVAGKNVPRLEKIQANVDKLLTATVTVDCAFVEDKLVPKMRENQDPKMAKKVFQLMLTAKCSDSPSFIEAGEMVFESEPAYGLAKVIALKHGANGNMGKANEYYDKAIGLTEDILKKSEIYMNKAQMHSNAGQKQKARLNARKALANNPAEKKAYTLIGNLYMQSYEECKKGESKVEDRLVFIAAYNQYKRAGDEAAMTKAKVQFPSIEEMFELGLSEGESKTVGCWINETVILARRPN